MNFRGRTISMVVATLLMAPLTAAIGKPTKGRDLLASLKVGQWIRIEGTPQRDGTMACTEVKQLTGDFLDHDWSVMGTVASVDHRGREFRIGPIRLRLANDAEFEGETGRVFKNLADVRAGMLLEVDGTYTKDGTFLAKDVDDESDEIKSKTEKSRLIRFIAKVEKSDATRRRIITMGTVFVVTPRTQLKSVMH
jgi:hypothetical protein